MRTKSRKNSWIQKVWSNEKKTKVAGTELMFFLFLTVLLILAVEQKEMEEKKLPVIQRVLLNILDFLICLI